MNLKSKLLKGVLALCIATSAASAQITNGCFNTMTFSGWATSGGCTGGSVGNMTGGPEMYNGMGGTWWADLTGCGWGNGRWIQQAVPTVVGQTYFLSFDLGCWNGQCFTDAGADLSINGTFVNRYSHATFTGNWLAWQRFQYCFVATTNVTTIRFTGNGWGTGYTPGWANTGGSYTGLGYEFSGVIGLDSILLDTVPVHILASDTCAPARLVCWPPSTNGTINWYFNGSLLSSGGPDTIVGSVPGIYTLEYITPCGTYTVEKTLVYCDTCVVEMTSAHYCLGDSTIFLLEPPSDCLEAGCIGEITIDYGDGSPIESSASGSARFAHQYGSPGVYTITYCWTNNCTGDQICKNFTITIAPCEGCDFEPDFNFDNCIPTQFNNTTTTPYPIISFHWNFGDGNTSSIPNPLHRYLRPGTYNVCLTIVVRLPNGDSCEKTVCRKIDVHYCDETANRIKTPKINTRPVNSNFDFEKEGMPGVSIFPNPTAGDLSISSIVFKTPGMTVYIYDISGRLLFEEKLNSGKKEILLPTKSLDRGTYLIKVKGQNYNRELKFIKE